MAKMRQIILDIIDEEDDPPNERDLEALKREFQYVLSDSFDMQIVDINLETADRYGNYPNKS